MNDTISYLKETLKDHFQPEEVKSLVHLIMKEICDLEPHQILLNKDKDLSAAEKELIRVIAERLCKQEPIQYILGHTLFYGYRFHVTPSVLIPRPETEELVETIIRDEQAEGLNILDVGTGSGCIAISLAKELKQASVSAIDISEEALTIAMENAVKNNADVYFLKTDILNDVLFKEEELDIIVSNPPYVLMNEKPEIRQNVLDHEPHTALFVPDEDPLLFYRAIAHFGTKHLKKGGRIYFEINASLGKETLELLQSTGYKNCILIKDLSGRDRIIKAIR